MDPFRATPVAPGWNRQELRLALSMRGGSSLAVWISGALAEIDQLRRTAGTGSAHPWAALADLAGYNKVRVDVLTGASAGGVNGTLFAASLVYGFPFTAMRDVWVRLADLEAMSRPVPGLLATRPPRLFPRPASILAGDDYFQERLGAELIRLVAAAPEHPPTAARRLDLGLSATLLDGVSVVRRDDRLGALHEVRRRAWFRFRHRGQPGDPLSGFAPRNTAARTLHQLALAGRATASFPVAFEPATVHSRPDPPPDAVDMTGVFSETGAEDAPPFHVVDGGVLDNIPVGAAIRAVAEAPADTPTERWLLYLNPDPSLGPSAPPAPQARPRAIPTGLRALRARLDQESLLADIDELAAYNQDVSRRELRAAALFAPLVAVGPADRPARLAELVDEVRTEHAEVRARVDAETALTLLTQPYLRAPGPLFEPIPADPLAGWSAAARSILPERLADRLSGAARAEPERVFTGVCTAAEAVEFCLRWARELERWAEPPRLGRIGTVKGRLYRLQQVVSVLAEYVDQRWWSAAVEHPVHDPAGIADWADGVIAERRRRQHALGERVREPLAEALRDGSDSEFQQGLINLANALRAEAASHRPGPVDAVHAAWQRLWELMNELAEAVLERPVHDIRLGSMVDPARNPELIGHAMLESAEPEQRPRLLSQLLTLTAPLLLGDPTNGRIAFLRVASDGRTDLPFDALRGKDGTLTPRDKLRGVDLDGFGAFLSAKWRANDWMWGRLDATASLVALLIDPQRLHRFHSGRSAEDVLAAVADIVTRPLADDELGTGADAQQWSDFFLRRWESRVDQVRAELRALFEQPDGDHPLTETKASLTERIHWGIAAVELPYVGAVGLGSDPEPIRPAPEPPEPLRAAVQRYEVSRQRLPDLGEGRLTRMGMRLGLVAYRAVKPDGWTPLPVAVRVAMTGTKPLWLTTMLALTAPERLLFVVATALATLLGTGWSNADIGSAWSPLLLVFSGEQTQWDAWRAVIAVLAVVTGVLALARGRLVLPRRVPTGGRRRPVWFAFLAVVVIILGFLGAFWDLVLGPLAVTVVAGVLTWIAAFWMRGWARVMAVLGVLGTYLGGALVLSGLGVPAGWWLVIASVAASYVVSVLVSVVDVLPPAAGSPAESEVAERHEVSA
ncbi:hypothetical protein GCM10012275_12110 [Longimycelium tulufanense]|uniref:PNPLA domain-containing protein n=1 Tax=Longimycelium tulufanense TaxID=907463 RepID=A0A8J3FUD6_9PSEU|nr:patatin-like protein [Longimycelium tulufanense]GGM42759.1 hypothetical protein GCM10012275_12110 [Longimycelium tulufanense]